MRRGALAALAVLASGFGMPAALAAPAPSPRELAADVERAAQTGGFRMRASVSREGESAAAALRITISGQKGERGQRLMIRAVAPDAERGHAVLVELPGEAVARAVLFTPAQGQEGRALDPYAPVLGSDLVPWDLLGAWWRWPRQTRLRGEALLGYDCEVLESRGGTGPVARVRSWVSPILRIPLKVELFGADGALLRTLSVARIARRAGGTGVARVMTITAGGRATRFEVYNAEEGVPLEAGAFAPPAPGKDREAGAYQ